ncbi:hypothetical protein F4678DRAFT_302021 [Xylaria arbuscula]|nr:hypothetical protein F4678DRAFT_302021 [Xylaria arbuscula]
MPDNTSKDGERRGFGLQCPWSNCFPQLYEHYSRLPCTLTPFADFREMIDHIWKYHSFLLSCRNCDYRFKYAKRADKVQKELDALKKDHLEKDCKNVTPNLEHYYKTMTDTQDKILKKWHAYKPKEEAFARSNYISLCQHLFGDGVKLPVDHRYNYFVPEYTTNKESFHLGEINLEYIRRRRFPVEPEPSSSSHQQPSFTYDYPQHMPHTIDPLLLDEGLEEGPQLQDWIVYQPGPDHDSAYGSGGTGESAPQQSTSTYEGYLPDLDDYNLSTVSFSHDTLAQRPTAITEDTWELENNYDESSV